MDLRRAFEKTVSEHPDRKALIGESETYTYRKLREEVRKVAGYIQSKGIVGENIAFSGPNKAKSLITILGIWYSGNTCVHINPRLEPDELPYYLEDSEAEAFFFHKSISQKVESVQDQLDLDYRSEMRNLEGREFENQDKGLEERFCSITYTSGTTGKPKGVPYKHSRLLHGSMILVIEAQESRGIELAIENEIHSVREEGPRGFSDETIGKFIESEPWKNDKHAVIYPLYHVSGTNPSFATLLGGGTLILPDRDTENIVHKIEEEEATLSGGVPAQLEDIIEKVEENKFDPSSLEFLHTAGGLLTDEVRERIVGTLTENLCHEYASSETLEMTYSLDNSGALGRPTCLQDIKIVEPGTLEQVDFNETGEVVVNTEGPTVFEGYWNKPEKTEKSIENGWYRTGDLARFDKEGRMWFEGRADDLIISGGENISPTEVENTLVSHPRVEKAGVIGIEDDTWGQRMVAFIESSAFDREELDKYLKQSGLANFKRPKEYVKVNKMPVKETSGVDRKKLEEIYDQT